MSYFIILHQALIPQFLNQDLIQNGKKSLFELKCPLLCDVLERASFILISASVLLNDLQLLVFFR